jgi:hypothetical protein
MWTFVVDRCYALYFHMNLVLRVTLGSHSVFATLTSYSSPDAVCCLPIIR